MLDGFSCSTLSPTNYLRSQVCGFYGASCVRKSLLLLCTWWYSSELCPEVSSVEDLSETRARAYENFNLPFKYSETIDIFFFETYFLYDILMKTSPKLRGSLTKTGARFVYYLGLVIPIGEVMICELGNQECSSSDRMIGMLFEFLFCLF